ncbi:MAG: hypothetical protein HQK60_14070 [Deltaproteobacteria bacterium]|nr:hypothetical protein [Deltaproteobacteria bacterium]
MFDDQYQIVNTTSYRFIDKDLRVGCSQASLRSLAVGLTIFIDRYKGHFVSSTRSVATQIKQYVFGLVKTTSGNMSRMEEVVVGANQQSLQHGITNSPWRHRWVTDQVALDADRVLGGSNDTFLIIPKNCN